MPKFAGMLEACLVDRGHCVTVWRPRAILYSFFANTIFAKWVGYFDQYILFPLWVRFKLLKQSRDTLYVFADQALGPWVPLVANRPHVVHAHDLLALRSALGLIPENPTSWTGKIYQRYLRFGFQHAKYFISVSNKTKSDLLEFGKIKPRLSEVVYNGLNYNYIPVTCSYAQEVFSRSGVAINNSGILLHISGNQWYKNVEGVIRIYSEYVKLQSDPLPLWLVGVARTPEINSALDLVPSSGNVQFHYNFTNEEIQCAYSLAKVFLFPSLAEGFGWPIVEAQACGCAVVTTDEAPMNEIGGPDARYIPRLTLSMDKDIWSINAARIVIEILKLSPEQERISRTRRISWSSGFDSDGAISSYIKIYNFIINVS